MPIFMRKSHVKIVSFDWTMVQPTRCMLMSHGKEHRSCMILYQFLHINSLYKLLIRYTFFISWRTSAYVELVVWILVDWDRIRSHVRSHRSNLRP